jgi:hypothetical protein
MYNREKIEEAVKAKGYKWFNSTNYDVNIVGIRNSETDNKVTNKFDDLITVSFKDECGEWNYFEFACTTDPGKYWVENIMKESGVAILKEGQYRGSHKIRKHQGKYEALCQQKPLKVYRDNNCDTVYDLIEENIEEGIFGINIHRATRYEDQESTQVDRWSAGCQVIAAYNGFRIFMAIMYKAREVWGNNFTYTLINTKDII